MSNFFFQFSWYTIRQVRSSTEFSRIDSLSGPGGQKGLSLVPLMRCSG